MDQVREADRDQGEDEATAGGWGEAGQPPGRGENASVLPVELLRSIRRVSHVIRLSVPNAGQVW
jgi:hypothetical protein